MDTLILGCTHYPLVAPMLQRMLGRDVRLVTAGSRGRRRGSAAPRGWQGSRAKSAEEGDYRFLCTGDIVSFSDLGTRFLQMPLAGRVERVEVS